MPNKKPIFIDGMNFNLPTGNTPDFIKGKISINLDQFLAFAEQYVNEDGYLNIDLKKSKKGKLYLQLNTWRPQNNRRQPKRAPRQQPRQQRQPRQQQYDQTPPPPPEFQ